MMRVKDAAARMGISESLVYELCASGALPHFRIGRPGSRGRIRIAETDIEIFLADQKVEIVAAPKATPARMRVFKHVVIPNGRD